MTNRIITVDSIKITINKDDFICISDFGKYKEGKSKTDDVIRNWLRNRITIEFLGTWEYINNPNFNSVEFDGIRKSAGLHTFTLSVKEWCEKTNAIGIYSKVGKTGGTYAHKDIAFEFASAISPVFKLYLIKEFERLKELENNNQDWNVKRLLSKNNYLIQTDAIKNYLLPDNDYLSQPANNLNLRDYASINELTVLSNIESHNAELIKDGISKEERFKILSEIAKYQLNILNNSEKIRMIKNND